MIEAPVTRGTVGGEPFAFDRAFFIEPGEDGATRFNQVADMPNAADVGERSTSVGGPPIVFLGFLRDRPAGLRHRGAIRLYLANHGTLDGTVARLLELRGSTFRGLTVAVASDERPDEALLRTDRTVTDRGAPLTTEILTTFVQHAEASAAAEAPISGEQPPSTGEISAAAPARTPSTEDGEIVGRADIALPSLDGGGIPSSEAFGDANVRVGDASERPPAEALSDSSRLVSGTSLRDLREHHITVVERLCDAVSQNHSRPAWERELATAIHADMGVLRAFNDGEEVPKDLVDYVVGRLKYLAKLLAKIGDWGQRMAFVLQLLQHFS